MDKKIGGESIVFPEESKLVGRTLEDRLADKFDRLQQAREDKQEDLFDEISRSIEVLLKGVPQAHDDLVHQREELDKDLKDVFKNIEVEANSARDDINRRAIMTASMFKAKWEYREVYEEIIIETLQKYKLLLLRRPMVSDIVPYDEDTYQQQYGNEQHQNPYPAQNQQYPQQYPQQPLQQPQQSQQPPPLSNPQVNKPKRGFFRKNKEDDFKV